MLLKFLALSAGVILLLFISGNYLLRAREFHLSIASSLVGEPALKPEAGDLKRSFKLYFSPADIGENCAALSAAEREFSEVDQEAQIAAVFKALLEGPTAAEKAAGLSTSIAPGVKLLHGKVTDKVLNLDFSKELGAGVAGACRVTAIRAQITATGLQFSGVTKTVISIESKTEAVLEP